MFIFTAHIFQSNLQNSVFYICKYIKTVSGLAAVMTDKIAQALEDFVFIDHNNSDIQPPSSRFTESAGYRDIANPFIASNSRNPTHTSAPSEAHNLRLASRSSRVLRDVPQVPLNDDHDFRSPVFHAQPWEIHNPKSLKHRDHHDHDRKKPNLSVPYLDHASAPESNMLLYLHKAINAAYPKAGIVTVADRSFNPLGFAADPKNQAKAVPNSSELPGSPFFEYAYLSPYRRSNEYIDGYPAAETKDTGSVGLSGITLARFDYTEKGEEYILYIINRGYLNLIFFVHEPKASSGSVEDSKFKIKELMVRIGYWQQQLHDEIWVYDGYWRKDHELWQEMQKASWDDVILPTTLKTSIRSVIGSFFKNKKTYDEIGIAWKRGLIFYGPPGNGKTISIKAIMNEIWSTFGIPTLYVKSVSYSGEIREMFEKARAEAPCMLVLEDLDSFINNSNRSYFLNQMDGLEDNNGILVLGTTNHPERLDPGIVARPSRFDRKYEFPLPGPGDGGRKTYIEYWR